MTNVLFNLKDFEFNILEARVILVPNVTPLAYSSSLAQGVPVIQFACNGTTTFNNLLPSVYSVSVAGCNAVAPFFINVPETNGSTVNANTLVVSPSYTIPSGSFNVISASFAVTASYAKNGGSGGTTLTSGSSYNITASNSISASKAVNANTASFMTDGALNTITFTPFYTTISGSGINLNGVVSINNGAQIDNFGNFNNADTNNSVTTNILQADTVNATTITGSLFGVLSGSLLGNASSATTAISSSYAKTASFALNSNGGTTLISGSNYNITASNAISASWAPASIISGTLLITASTYQITSSRAVTSSFASTAFTSAFASTTALIPVSAGGTGQTTNRSAGTNTGILMASPLGGNNAITDIQAATASFEGQMAMTCYGGKDPFIWFAAKNGATGSDWNLACFFLGGIAQVGDRYNSRGLSNCDWILNGSSAGSSATGDSIFRIFNYSTSSINSGPGLGLVIHDANGNPTDTVGCSFNHVPSNRDHTLIPGNSMLVFNKDAVNQKGFSICGPAMAPYDSGNYSFLYCDFFNKLFRIPFWTASVYQPSEAGWRDALTVNPFTADTNFYGTASFHNAVYVTGSLNGTNIIATGGFTGSLSGSAVSASFAVTASNAKSASVAISASYSLNASTASYSNNFTASNLYVSSSTTLYNKLSVLGNGNMPTPSLTFDTYNEVSYSVPFFKAAANGKPYMQMRRYTDKYGGTGSHWNEFYGSKASSSLVYLTLGDSDVADRGGHINWDTQVDELNFDTTGNSYPITFNGSVLNLTPTTSIYADADITVRRDLQWQTGGDDIALCHFGNEISGAAARLIWNNADQSLHVDNGVGVDLAITSNFYLVRMIKSARNAIVSPVQGQMIFQMDNTPGLRVYNGTHWVRYTETNDD